MKLTLDLILLNTRPPVLCWVIGYSGHNASIFVDSFLPQSETCLVPVNLPLTFFIGFLGISALFWSYIPGTRSDSFSGVPILD